MVQANRIHRNFSLDEDCWDPGYVWHQKLFECRHCRPPVGMSFPPPSAEPVSMSFRWNGENLAGKWDNQWPISPSAVTKTGCFETKFKHVGVIISKITFIPATWAGSYPKH